MCFHPKVSLRAESDRESMVPEQAIHEGILRLHHRLTLKKHSSGAAVLRRRTLRTMCVGAETICVRIWSRT